MAVVVTSRTSLLVTAITVGLVFIPAVVGQAQCSDYNLVATGSAKYITSPGYPNIYPSNSVCHWRITADLSSRVVVLKLLDFYLEGVSPSCLYDKVAIYDGYSTSSPRIELLCGQVSNARQFISTGLYLLVEFYSESSNTFRGFKFEYTSKDTSALCPYHTLPATGSAKYITSPGYPYNAPSYMDCHWSITAELSSQVVVLKLISFYLEGYPTSCSNNYVAIFDGDSSDSNRIQLLCDQITNTQQYTSSGPLMTVVFHSDGSNNFKRFNFDYTSVDKSVLCTDSIIVATEAVKYIYSPGYPNNYLSSLHCQWHITSGSDSRVVALGLILAGSQLDCTSDYVRIYDGPSTSSPLMQAMCGQIYVKQLVSTNSDVTIVFHADGYIYHYAGFNFTYQTQKKTDLGSDQRLPVTVSHNAGIIAGIVAASIAASFIILVSIIFVQRRISTRKRKNTRNRVSRSNEAAVRPNSLFTVSLPTAQRATVSPYLGIENSQSISDAHIYSTLDSISPRSPGYRVNDPPPYSRDLPGGTAQQTLTDLLESTRPARARDGVISISNGVVHFNRGFNSTRRDEVVRGHMTDQNVSFSVNFTRNPNNPHLRHAHFPIVVTEIRDAHMEY